MSAFNREAARLRRELAQRPGFFPEPRCDNCNSQVRPALYSAHHDQCVRDCASEAIHAIDVRLAYLWSTEPGTPDEASAIATEQESLRQERTERFYEVAGLDAFGRGRVDTGVSAADEPTVLD